MYSKYSSYKSTGVPHRKRCLATSSDYTRMDDSSVYPTKAVGLEKRSNLDDLVFSVHCLDERTSDLVDFLEKNEIQGDFKQSKSFSG